MDKTKLQHTIVNCVTALLCTIAIAVTANSVTAKVCEDKASAASASAADDASGSDSSTDDTFNNLVGGDTAGADSSASGSAATSGDASSASGSAASGSASSSASGSSSSSSSGSASSSGSSSSSSSASMTAAQVLALYNKSINNAVSSKAGFSKSRITDNDKIDSNGVVKQFKTLIYKFIGIGEENKYTETYKKGTKLDHNPFLMNSTLSSSNITSAKSAVSGGNYVVQIKVKSGTSTSSKSGSTNSSPIDNCGICVGNDDKGYWDHKRAQNIYDAIQGTFASAEVSEKSSNCVITAQINKSSGKIVKLVVEWDMHVTIKKFAGMSASASGTSHVTYTNFVY